MPQGDASVLQHKSLPARAPEAVRGDQKALFERASPAEIKLDVPVSVEGTIARVTYENASTGFRVLRVDVAGRAAAETWVGVVPSAIEGSRVRATGRYVLDQRHGVQLKADSLLTVAPDTLDGLEKYLGSGMIPGIGAAFAKRIVESFGDQTLEVLDRDPGRLSEVPGLGPARSQAVVKAWGEQRQIGAIMIFLQSHGVSPALASRIYRRFGQRAMEVVSRSPYRLALDVSGVGFKTADRIARSIGVDADAPERAQAGVLQTLHDLATRGHVFGWRNELAMAAAAMLEVETEHANAAIDALAAARHVTLDDAAGSTAVYASELYEAEVSVGARLSALGDTLAPQTAGATERLTQLADRAMASFEQRMGMQLASTQRDAVRKAAESKVLIVTGGPGVGKTTIVRAILTLFDAAGLSVRLAAPTGRAAKRMSESTSREAVTLHRLLEFDPKRRQFTRRKENPVDANCIIVDEASMLDIFLADALLQAVPDSARLLLVGDVDQLPSVGPGAVLRDAIESGAVATVRLTQIFRQAEGSLIVKNAHRIHEGEMPEGEKRQDGEFYLVERTSPSAASDSIVQLVTERIPQRFKLDPVRDIQVLTPMHRGEAGAIALNERLQAALNPNGARIRRGGREFRIADKVMQLRNDYEREVYNGDIGFITSVDEEHGTVNIRFDDRTVAFTAHQLDDLTLAYATSIHKSQGSEYAAVVIPILTQHYVMLSRNLIYTAVTRGKRLVVLVSDPRALGLALNETRKEDRCSRLAARLSGAALSYPALAHSADPGY